MKTSSIIILFVSGTGVDLPRFYYFNSEIRLNESSTIEFKAGGGPNPGSRYYRDTFPEVRLCHLVGLNGTIEFREFVMRLNAFW